MSGVRSEFSKMCTEPINPQIVKLSRNFRTCWYIFGVSNFLKMTYFKVWGSDQHSDPTITLTLEFPLGASRLTMGGVEGGYDWSVSQEFSCYLVNKSNFWGK